MISNKWVYLIVIILLSLAVFAPEEEYEPNDSRYWDNPDNVGSATNAQVAQGLESGAISREKMRELNYEQLSGNLDKVDNLNDLEDNELSKVLVRDYGYASGITTQNYDGSINLNENGDLQLYAGAEEQGYVIRKDTPVGEISFGNDNRVMMSSYIDLDRGTSSQIVEDSPEIQDTPESGGSNLEGDAAAFGVAPVEGAGGNLEGDVAAFGPGSASASNTGAPQGNIDAKVNGGEIGSNTNGNVELSDVSDVTYSPTANPEDNVEASNAHHVSFGSNGVQFQDAAVVQVADQTVTTGIDVYVTNDGQVYAGTASSVMTPIYSGYDVTQYYFNDIVFSVQSAGEVKIGDYSMTDVQDATYEVNDDGFIVTLNSPDTVLVMSNSGLFEFNFTGYAEGSQLIFSYDGSMNITNGFVAIANEKFDTNASIDFEIDEATGSVKCMHSNPPSTYYYYDQFEFNPIHDFALHTYMSSYTLCFRRNIAEYYPQPTSPNEGLVDLYDDKQYYIGQVQYLRYPFTDDSVTGLDFYPVYEGIIPTVSAYIDLEYANLDEFNIDQVNGRSSVSSPAKYITIVEDGDSWVSLSHQSPGCENVAFDYNSGSLQYNEMEYGNHRIEPVSELGLAKFIGELALEMEELMLR